MFWEIKNGKITRMCTDVTYNAITTDFWGNLDGVTGPSEYQKFGTGGDAKGQPTQTNSISHGSPWLLIRKMMVGPICSSQVDFFPTRHYSVPSFAHIRS